MFNNRVCYRGSSEKWQIWVHWWHFLTALGYCEFWLCFITKVWSVLHIIIVMFINGVYYRGSSEMCQIWVQWWHFWRLLVSVDFDDSFNTKVWLVDHIIIVIYTNGVWTQWLFSLKRNHLFFQWKLVLAKILFCSILNFGIFYCILEFCPYNVQFFAKNSPVILQKWAPMKN